MIISGGFAGLVGMGPLLSYHHQYSIDFPAGLGLAGIGVALLGRNHPIGMAFEQSYLLFGEAFSNFRFKRRAKRNWNDDVCIYSFNCRCFLWNYKKIYSDSTNQRSIKRNGKLIVDKLIKFLKENIDYYAVLLIISIAQIDQYSQLTTSGTFGSALGFLFL